MLSWHSSQFKPVSPYDAHMRHTYDKVDCFCYTTPPIHIDTPSGGSIVSLAPNAG